ncbi:MAG TPA: sulfotransferase domain-containing protein [Gammaproteobacteria bacterium]
MAETEITYPQKTRELHNALMDSDRWDSFRFRDDDIVIDTWAKSGTTWTQQIMAQLVFNGIEGTAAMDLAPWLDMRIFPLEEILGMLEAQEHRRFVKSHLPADALTISPKAKYLFLARDGRDVIWSLHNHLRHQTDEFYEIVNNTPGRVGPEFHRPPEDVREFFHHFIDNGSPFTDWPYFDHIQSWWDIRHTPNIMLVHFNDLKADMEGMIRKMAAFVDIEIDEDKWPDIVEHCSFDYMKANANTLSPGFADLFEGGLTNFIHKGTNGRWRDILTPEEVEKYERAQAEKLTPNCARWHEVGGPYD